MLQGGLWERFGWGISLGSNGCLSFEINLSQRTPL